MYILNYIGPFLRINSLKSNQVEKQLFYLSKEAIKYLTLTSRCGITIPQSELKSRNFPNIDNNIINSISPLLCIYKKAHPKLISIGNNLCFDEDALKKEINIESNGFMTLCLLELIEYYNQFKDIDNKKYSLSNLYLILCKRQLEFYATNFRNIEGVFVDKKNVSHNLNSDFKFEEKNKKFKYSDQAIQMTAFYKYSLFDKTKCGEEYRNFSMDILKMFLEYKDELYLCSREELIKLCFAFNVFYKYSNIPEVKILLLDLMEFLIEDNDFSSKSDIKIEEICLTLINSILFYKSTNILKFKDISEEIFKVLLDMYDPELGIFIKPCEKKEISYGCLEILSYLISMLCYNNLIEKSKDSDMIIIDIFKRQIIDSELILSWPQSPNLDDVERYENFSAKAENLLDEQFFRMSFVPSPEICELPPIFIKNITYNKKKGSFSQGKTTFDSSKNLFIFFLIIYITKIFNENNL
ncbi:MULTISPECIES: hypothetical protein [Clostridium]|uniref:hypothetical protein n=1 Tax=Clostridium TaxID=1485 RepID=UPI001D18D0A1|nr:MULTISPECIES: hypothetical protein [Clostridium]